MQPSLVNARALAKSGMEALQKGERAQVCALFEAMDEHSGSVPSWEI